MSQVIIAGDTSGTITLQAPAVSGTTTLTLPATTATLATLTTPSFATTIGVGAATASASGSGITFPATQSASSDANTLDDYEEGTWTPSVTFNNASVGQTGTFAGFYTKIGNQVFATCLIGLTAKGSSTGVVAIGGLPFASNSNANYRAMSSTINWGNLATNYVSMIGLMSPNVTYIDIYAATAATASSSGNAPQHTDVNNTSNFRISITYQV